METFSTKNNQLSGAHYYKKTMTMIKENVHFDVSFEFGSAGDKVS